MLDSQAPPRLPLRVAIVSTPRTGNTWLRHLLSRIWSLPQVAVHALDKNDWHDLPRECVLQLHWPYSPEFAQRLAAAGFQIINLARHPFDVLISILHVAIYDVRSECWLQGLHGDESVLWAAMPTSQAFFDYAAGPRAQALFDISNRWWTRPENIKVRYEDLVREPECLLRKLQSHLGPPRGETIAAALEATSIPRLREQSGHSQHFWLGRPGLWRELITASRAHELRTVLQSAFDIAGYSCDPDPDLTPSAADRNWIFYFGHELRLNLNRLTELKRTSLGQMQARLEESNEAMKDWELRYVRAVADKQTAEMQRAAADRELQKYLPLIEQAVNRLPLIHGCGRFSLRIARLVQAGLNRLNLLRRRRPRSSRWSAAPLTNDRIFSNPLTSHAEISS